jgi:hypothetical protein
MKIILIYNSESGLFNKMSDWTHKAFSPKTYSCSLCSITHDNFGKKKEWEQFIKKEPYEFKFMYKNDYTARFYKQLVIEFPVILLESNNGIQILLSKSEIKAMANLTELLSEVKNRTSKIRD